MARHMQQPRQMNVTLSRVEPWSVMKFSFTVALIVFCMLFAAAGILTLAGVFAALQHFVTTSVTGTGRGAPNVSGWFSGSRLVSYVGLVGSVETVIVTALATVCAVIYNQLARLSSGLAITVRETR